MCQTAWGKNRIGTAKNLLYVVLGAFADAAFGSPHLKRNTKITWIHIKMSLFVA